MKEITSETVNTFLNGHDPMERIVDIECDYMDDYVSVIYVNENGQKMIHKDGFKPFLWAKNSVCVRMFDGNRLTLRRKLKEYGIGVKLLTFKTEDSAFSERLENGYKYLFYSRRKCSYQHFMNFFKEAGTPIYEKASKDEDQKDGSKEFLTCTPVEQYMIESGKRLFKGYDNYDDLNRLQFDIETTGLDPYTCHIEQIGIRNKKNNFEKVINVKGEGEELRINELKAIDEFLYTLSILKPDVIAGHNSENFDWIFFMVRAKIDGSDFGEMSKKYFKHPIYKKKKESVLKLGGEMEFYKPTIMWGHNILDSLHAARRAQAIDSNMKKSTLKYVCKYLKLTKPNRVYVPGDVISKIWNETEENYAFNDKNGDWYKVDLKHPLKEEYVMTSGEYIVKRYLLDDIWETDQVELKLNESNFLVGKMIPTTFSRACTMGTAGIWKLIMLAWCYENELAVPATAPNKRFTGGLSRLLKTGYVSRIVKLDYNSLYPSIILTWNIATPLDITHIMLHLLEYILTQREKYKGLKADAGKKAEELSKELEEKKATLSPDEVSKAMLEIQKWQSEKMANDKKQLPLKIFGNSFFGSYGCPMIFPFGDIDAAEMTTCIGRMSLRLMISHFTNLGYMPIVGDSFTGDTPLFIKYDDGNIDIKPIEELIGETETDALGREYDYSEKPYSVLCRSGWVKPKYIYRHKTNKQLYTVSEGDMSITVTEDHSLFNNEQKKIKPSQINSTTKLEYYTKDIKTDSDFKWLTKQRAKTMAKMIIDETIDRVSIALLNTNDMDCIKAFLDEFKDIPLGTFSKTCQAGILLLKRKIDGFNFS